MTASPHEFLHPAGWKPALGYANGVAAEGRTVFVGGMIGWNAQQEFETDDFVGQVRQALQNIVDVVREAGGVAFVAAKVPLKADLPGLNGLAMQGSSK